MGLLGKGNKNKAKYRSQSADRRVDDGPMLDVYGRPLTGGYNPPYPESMIGGYPGNQSTMGTNQRGPIQPNQGPIPQNMPIANGKTPKGMVMSKYPPWDPRWEKDHQKLLKRHQTEQQKLLKEQQKEAQKQLKLQQEQLKIQETQMRRMQEEQMKQFQDQQRNLQEEQDKQLQLLQQYADLQQQQQQQQQLSMPTHTRAQSELGGQAMPGYDYSTLGTMNLDYSTLGTLAYGTYPGAEPNAAALNAAYAQAYWTMLYQQNPYLLANYTLPRIQAEERNRRRRGRDEKRQSRTKYRKNKHSKEATLVTEDNRRHKSMPDSESSDLFISGSASDGEKESPDDFKNQLLAQKNKLKKTEDEAKEEEEEKQKQKSPKNQPIFMAELQKRLRDKQKNQNQKNKVPPPPVPLVSSVPPVPPHPAPEDVYGIYGYVPGAPVPVPMAPPPPVMAPYIAPGAPQVGTSNDMEAVRLMQNMSINNALQNNTAGADGPVLPVAQRNEPNDDIYDDSKSAIYAVPQKKRNVQPKPQPVLTEEDYEEQASGLLIDDVMDDMEAETGVVNINKKDLIKLNGQPDDMMSAVFTADKDGTETTYATNDDIYQGTTDTQQDTEQEEEANMVLDNEDPPPGRGAAELGVWREDHGTTRSPPPSYYTYSPDEEPAPQYQPNPPQNRRPQQANRRYNRGKGPQRKANKRVVRPNNANQNQNRYPVQPRRRNNNCTIQ